MDEHGISIAALAREAKCPAPNVSNWLAGKKDVTLETAVRIFAAAGMPLRVDGA